MDKAWTDRGTDVVCRGTDVVCRGTDVVCRGQDPPISSLNLHLEKLLTRVAFADHIFDQAGVAIIIVGRLLGV